MFGIKAPAIPASLRRTNERTTISLLLQMGIASRADLAKAAGISAPTAGKITTELLRLGVLQEVEPTDPGSRDPGKTAGTGRLGRPGQLLRLDCDTPRFLAVELGVFETRLATLPVSVQSEDRWSFTFPTPAGAEAWVTAMRRLQPRIARSSLQGVLVSVPGIVDERIGKVLYSPNLHWTERVRLPDALQPLWEMPVLLLQEIRALALGHLAVEADPEDFLLVDFGQGVGGAVVLGGQLHTGPMPLCGELGHTPVPGNERRCGCGAIGCLETLTSQRGLLESLAGATGRPQPAWEDLQRQVTQNGVEPWLGRTLDAAAIVIAGAMNVLGVRRVVVTGSLNDLSVAVVEHLSAAVRRGALWARFGEVICQAAPRRRGAGLVAAGIDRLMLPALADPGRTARASRSSGKALKRGALGPAVASLTLS